MQDWWEARRQSSKFFEAAVVIPDEFPVVDIRIVSSQLTASWGDVDFKGLLICLMQTFKSSIY